MFLDLSETVLLGVSLELESVFGLMSSLCCESELTELPSPSPSPPLNIRAFSSACCNHRHMKFKVNGNVLYLRLFNFMRATNEL